MSKKNDISETDRNLFRSSVGKVNRIEDNRISHPKLKPLSVTTSHRVNWNINNHFQQAISQVANTEISDKLNFKQPGVQQRTMEKLRRGQYPAENHLDLHGLTIIRAEETLKQFLDKCHQNKNRCVRIIHGKGHGSINGKPVIKNKLNEWLRMNKNILAFCSAKPNDGGTGAVYVLLKNIK
jgi:DNA-nicking Smr family endonuclease